MTLTERVVRLVVPALTVLVMGCGGSSSPSAPTQATASLTLTYTPSPAAWTAGPGATAACATAANVWKFTSNFRETAGTSATLVSVVTAIDGTAQAAVAVSIAVPASGTTTRDGEICFGTATQHTLQHTFSGTDAQGRAVSVTGPQLVLSAR